VLNCDPFANAVRIFDIKTKVLPDSGAGVSNVRPKLCGFNMAGQIYRKNMKPEIT